MIIKVFVMKRRKKKENENILRIQFVGLNNEPHQEQSKSSPRLPLTLSHFPPFSLSIPSSKKKEHHQLETSIYYIERPELIKAKINLAQWVCNTQFSYYFFLSRFFCSWFYFFSFLSRILCCISNTATPDLICSFVCICSHGNQFLLFSFFSSFFFPSLTRKNERRKKKRKSE